MFAYNDSVHPATGMTPFELDLGRHPATPASMLARDLLGETSGEVRQETAATFITRVNSNLQRARIRLEVEQTRMRRQLERTHRGHDFAVGTLVLLNWRVAGKAGERLGKLRPQWLGPFRILEKVHSNAYRLELPNNIRIHPVVNARYLKLFHFDPVQTPDPSPIATKVTTILDFKVEVEGDGRHVAFYHAITEPALPEYDVWLSTQQIVDAGGFMHLQAMLNALPDLKHQARYFIGRTIHKDFTAGRFAGLVSAFDPLDKRMPYEIVYEDGDTEWISTAELNRASKLKPLSIPAMLPKPPAKRIRALVLFSGTNSVGKQLSRKLLRQVTVTNVDLDPSAPQAVHMDIRRWNFRAYPPGYFAFIWASPPCQEYSVAKTTGTRDFATADAFNR